MTLNRRRFLVNSSASLALGAFHHSLHAAEAPRKLGLIFPPADRGVPEEGLAMYGNRIEYVMEGLGLQTMTPAGYDAVIDKIKPASEKLAQHGAEAIVLTGTSLTFYKGEAFNQQITETIRAASGLPAITMSTAVIDGLKAVGAKHLVAATAYNDEVNDRLRAFLLEHGFDVLKVQGLGIEKVEDINLVTQMQLIDFGTEVVLSTPATDTLLVSCGGLRTLEILAPLEARTRVPAITSMPHALFAGAKLLGMNPYVAGYGRLLAG